MVVCYLTLILAKIARKNRPGVSNICTIDFVRSHKKHNGARARSISYCDHVSFHKLILTSPAAHPQRVLKIIWKLRLARNVIMQIVSKKLSTSLATMTVENRKELYLKLRLFFTVRLESRFFKVENNAYAIFIIVSDQAVMSIGAVCNHVWNKRTLRYFRFFDDRPSHLNAKMLWSNDALF